MHIFVHSMIQEILMNYQCFNGPGGGTLAKMVQLFYFTSTVYDFFRTKGNQIAEHKNCSRILTCKLHRVKINEACLRFSHDLCMELV